jgi:hypothetical protein
MESVDPGRRWAVAANWRMDHRVFAGRESRDLLAFPLFASPGNAGEWWTARHLYFKSEICLPSVAPPGVKISSFCRPTNDGNLCSTRATGFDRLVHVGSLNAILGRIIDSLKGKNFEDASIGFKQFASGRGLPSLRSQLDRDISGLAAILANQGSRTVQQAAGFLVNLLGDTEPPWWACYEEEVEAVLDSGNATDLCAALGLGHLGTVETYLLAWIYRSDEALPLYRPTAVEANDSPYHFPSPPGYDRGITMPLSSGMSACREVLHRPLRGVLAAERCTGQIIPLRTSMAKTSDELATLRAAHWARLREEFYTDGLEPWLQRHPELS